MSRENLEAIQRLFDEWDAEHWRQLFAENIVWDTTTSNFPIAGVFEGLEGAQRFFREWLGPFADAKAESIEVIDAGDSVVSHFRWHAKGRTSGAPVVQDFFGVYDFEDGRVVRFRAAAGREEALRMAGVTGDQR